MKMHVITVFGQKDLMKLDSKEFNTSITFLSYAMRFIVSFILCSNSLNQEHVAFRHPQYYDPILTWLEVLPSITYILWNTNLHKISHSS